MSPHCNVVTFFIAVKGMHYAESPSQYNYYSAYDAVENFKYEYSKPDVCLKFYILNISVYVSLAE